MRLSIVSGLSLLVSTLGGCDLLGLGSGDAIRLSVGGRHNCLLREGGEVHCWGATDWGQAGQERKSGKDSVMQPSQVQAVHGATDLASASNTSCARGPADVVTCWGRNAGKGSAFAFPNGPLASNCEASCVVAGGKAECFGENAWGVLSPNDPAVLGEQKMVRWAELGPLDFGAPVRALGLGGKHGCAILEDATISCWGLDNFQQLGGLGGTRRASITQIPGLTDVHAIASGTFHTCVALEDGTVRCWGKAETGALGVSEEPPTSVATPAVVPGLTGVEQLAADGDSTCALDREGGLWCWGDNEHGQLGVGDAKTRWVPTRVDGLPPLASMGLSNHGCALTRKGQVWCWGDNEWGAVGDGTTNDRLAPVRVWPQ